MIKKINAEWVYILLGIVSYIMCVNFSKDWINYFWWYDLLEKTSWKDFLHGFSVLREPLYNYTAKLFSPYIGFSRVVLIATVTLLWIKLRAIRDIVSHEYVGTFFYICLYLFLFEGTQLRVAYATAFIVLGLCYLQKNRYLISLLMILIASQIQLTALLFSFIFILYISKAATWATYAGFLIAPLLVIFKISIISLLKPVIALINPRYLLYIDEVLKGQNSTGLYFYFIAFYWSLLIFTEWKLATSLNVDKFKLALQRIAMLGVILMCVFHDHVAMGARLGELLLFPVVILLSWLYLEWRKENNRLALGLLTSFSCLYFMARFIYLFPSVYSSLLSAN